MIADCGYHYGGRQRQVHIHSTVALCRYLPGRAHTGSAGHWLCPGSLQKQSGAGVDCLHTVSAGQANDLIVTTSETHSVVVHGDQHGCTVAEDSLNNDIRLRTFKIKFLLCCGCSLLPGALRVCVWQWECKVQCRDDTYVQPSH